MNTLPFTASPVARACATALLCGAAVAAGSQAFAATAAGQAIKNIATVTYKDAAGNTYSADSNEAVVTVAQVYSATIGVDNDKTAARGETVYLPYELTNTGNGTDLFEVTIADGATGTNLASTSRTVYLDANGNGRPDSGENPISTLSIDAGDSADLVVALQIPSGATAGQVAGVTLTARAQNGTGGFVDTSVDDLSPSNGRDTLEGTVESRVTVTEDAVLTMTKTSSHDTANNRITYTVSVTNNGQTVARDVVLFDGIPAGTTIALDGGGNPIVADSGLLAGNSDTDAAYTTALSESGNIRFNLDADDTDATEQAIGQDLDSDGTVAASGAVPGVFARDAELAPNATISLTFTVEYDPVALGGGSVIGNTAHLTADSNNDGVLDGTDVLSSSPKANDTVPTSYAVDITDTDGVAPTDTQTVASAGSGGVADFDVVVTNAGNADDSFELSIDAASSTFPTGTVFAFFESTGTSKLIDANGLGGVDTGVLAKGASRTVRVRATLPQGQSGATGYAASVRAVSASDPAVVPSADPASTSSIDLVGIALGEIVASRADIHADANGTDTANEDPLVTSPYGVVETVEADAGTSVDVPFFIDNESGLPDSYQLSAGSSLAGTTLGALPAGWSVQFFLTDDPNGDGTGTLTATGSAVSSAAVAAGRLNFPVIARVTVPSDALQAAADVDYDTDGDGTVEPSDAIDGNGDGDGDYPLFLRIFSPTSNATDTMLDAIDVRAGRAISFTPDATNQVELGGTVDYTLTLSNDGNSVERVELTSVNSQAGEGFANTVSIDTDGDGSFDTVLENLLGAGPGFVPVAPIDVRLADGTVVQITVENADNDAFPELVLPPGVDIPFLATVLAPTSAAATIVDALTVSATNVDPDAAAPDASVSFLTNIVNGSVRLVKTVAVDANCDGDNGDAADPVGGFNADSPFAEVQSVRVEPGECALWRIVAENQGDADALEVFVTDPVTPFSDFLVGSLRGCIGNACVPAPTPTANVFAAESGGVVRFNLGDGATATTGGTLIPGQKATLQFGVTVR